MNISEYIDKINSIGFEEYPFVMTGEESSLKDIVDLDSADVDLKIYISKVILCRCFSPTGGICWPDNPDWFIRNFLNTYNHDFIKPWLTTAIKEAIKMIMSGDTFDKEIIGTTFMYGIVEFYAKHKLGFRPELHDFFDSDNLGTYRKMFIGDAIKKLKKTNTPIAKSLNDIDRHNTTRLKEVGIPEYRWIKAKIADRLSLARNTMLHGENHSFYSEGQYLVMLYILFYLHDLKEKKH